MDQDANGAALKALDPEDGTVVQPTPILPPALPFGDRQSVDDLYLSASSDHVPNRQEIEIAPIDATTGATLFAETAPGFVASLVPSSGAPIVIVIDQTGGTGDTARMVDSRVTAYGSTTAKLLWREALPGTPPGSSGDQADTIIVPTESQLVAFNTLTGPGDGPIVGLITAEEPYRD